MQSQFKRRSGFLDSADRCLSMALNASNALDRQSFVAVAQGFIELHREMRLAYPLRAPSEGGSSAPKGNRTAGADNGGNPDFD